MAMISIDRKKCRKDGICAAECPFSLIGLTGEDGFPEIRPAAARLCILCGHCVAVCPHDALSLTAMNPDDFQPIGNGALPTLKKTGQLLTSRRSIRSYQHQTVPRPYIEQLLEICRWAPSAKNEQPVHWLVLETTEAVQHLAGLVVDWLRTGTSYPGIVSAWDQGKDMVLRGAPHLLVAHAREKSLKPEIDCTIALTYFDLAASQLRDRNLLGRHPDERRNRRLPTPARCPGPARGASALWGHDLRLPEISLFQDSGQKRASDHLALLNLPPSKRIDMDNTADKKKPDPERVALLRSLPLEIKSQITGEEARAFMYGEDLPESLLEKLKDYLEEDSQPK